MVSARLIWRGVRPCLVAPVAGAGWLLDKAVAWAEVRFDGGDPFVDVTLADEPAPAPQLALPAAAVEPAPLSLPPDQALRALHGQYPDLPGSFVHWHICGDGVLGEVNALDADEAGQRRIVDMYAAVLAAPVTEDTTDAHVTVSVVGVFASVAFTVAAVLLHDDTMPLPVFDAAAADPTVGDATLTTQHIPERVLAEVVGAR